MAKPSATDTSYIHRTLARLMQKGQSFGEALNALNQHPPESLRAPIAQLHQAYRDKGELRATLLACPELFDADLIQLLPHIDTDEGKTAQLLMQYHDYRALFKLRMGEIYSPLLGGLGYAFAVLGIALVLIAFLLAFVVPQFADMYAGFGSELPALTQALIDASDVFLSIWWLVLLALVGAVIGLRQTLFRFTKSLQLRDFRPGFGRIPLFGKKAMWLYQSKVVDLMRLMLDQGVAFATATRAILAPHYRSEAAQRRLLTQALGEHALEQIEASGRLDLFAEEFQDVSLNFHRQLMARMNRNSRLAEIGLIIFIGVIVGLMVIAIYLPIFKMGGAI